MVAFRAATSRGAVRYLEILGAGGISPPSQNATGLLREINVTKIGR
jgi:hypothetical protein